MKTRITFIHDAAVGGDWDPTKQLKIKPSSLQIRGLKPSVQEVQLTFNLTQLPLELGRASYADSLGTWIRWQSSKVRKQSGSIDPYGSNLAPGLHVFASAYSEDDFDRAEDDELQAEELQFCPTLAKIFKGVTKCKSQGKSFTKAEISEMKTKFGRRTSLRHYHQLVPDLSLLADYVRKEICIPLDTKSMKTYQLCNKLVDSLRTADAFDVDLNGPGEDAVLRIYHYFPPQVDEVFDAVPDTRIEVGVLTLEGLAPGSTDGEDAATTLSLGGLVTMVGEDKKPSQILFSFPSRHHSSSTAYNVSFNQPTGLHPTMRISFPNGTPKPPRDTFRAGKDNKFDVEADGGRVCALHAHLTLPSYIFPDKYQLAAPNFLAANNLRQIRSLTSPPPDLEAPDWAVDAWGSNMLMELAPPTSLPSSSSSSSSSSSTAWSAEIPLHLRYLKPSLLGHRSVDVPWPTVFWVCEPKDQDPSSGLGTNPFDRRYLGYDGPFSQRTIFYHLTPSSSPVSSSESTTLISTIQVPVLNESAFGAASLRSGTAVVVLLSLAWVAWKLVYVSVAGREAGGLERLSRKGRVDSTGKEKAS